MAEKTQTFILVPALDSSTTHDELIWTRKLDLTDTSGGDDDPPANDLRDFLSDPRDFIGSEADFPEDQALTILFISGSGSIDDNTLIAEGIVSTSYLTVRHKPADPALSSRIERSKRLATRLKADAEDGNGHVYVVPDSGGIPLAYGHYHLDPDQYEMHRYHLVRTPEVLPYFFSTLNWMTKPDGKTVTSFRMADGTDIVQIVKPGQAKGAPHITKYVRPKDAAAGMPPAVRVVYQEPPVPDDDDPTDPTDPSDPPPCVKVSGTMDGDGNFVVDTVMLIRYGDDNGGGGNGG